MLIQGSASCVWVARCDWWVTVTTLTSLDGMSTGVRLIPGLIDAASGIRIMLSSILIGQDGSFRILADRQRAYYSHSVVQTADGRGRLGGDGPPAQRAAQADGALAHGPGQLRNRMTGINQRLEPRVSLGGVHLAPRRHVFGRDLDCQQSLRGCRTNAPRRGRGLPKDWRTVAFGV